MTREEAIKAVIEAVYEVYGDSAYTKKIFKALEQETVLDKVKAEVKAMSGDIETIADVLEIIDKYGIETEKR